MLTGFKNAVEVDFTLEENKKKIEEAFKQAHAEAGAVYPLIIGGKKVETEICRRKSTCIKKTCSTSDREPFHHGCMECP